MRVIVHDYRDHYESINMVDAKSIFLLKVRYHFKGYRVWAFPTLWMARIWYRLTKKPCYRGTNVHFEKFVPGSDQVTFWQPWMNFH